ncbi:hypothetical protein MKX03_011500 [Papaver bracteatum]|nr:hypothetical protein MKX03_011500 [Papaver bracteatum]
MGEFLSPNQMAKQKALLSSRIQPPTSPFFLGSNDDQLERAQARAARAAAIRRKSTTSFTPYPPPSSDPCFSKEQISALFQNCIKLASENKINQKNTWELTLIDHLSELIKVEAEDDVETNFQKASCTLEAGVKIYALRVDSVHSEAYKVLGGINRAGREDEQETIGDGECINGEHDEGRAKKDTDKKMSPISTLESSFESLNVKKFDAAFAVDPLYHQTSAQFDEGGGKGLLLTNLGVYGDCRVVFDSLEAPGKCRPREPQSDKSEVIDISFARESIEQMAINMSTSSEISPSLRIIINQFDETNQRPSDTFSAGFETTEQSDTFADNQADMDDDASVHCEGWSFDHDDQASVIDENSNNMDQNFPSHQEEGDSFQFQEPGMADRFEKVSDFLFLGLGFTSNQNAWAGPEHWKFRKAKASGDVPVAENAEATTKRPNRKKQAESDIDFTKSLEKEIPDLFAAPKNPKSLLLRANRDRCNTTLPEDCHYQPEDLVKLFLLPNVMCLGKRVRKMPDESRCDGDFEPGAPWDNESVLSDHFDDGNVHSDVEDSSTLVSQPRQVNKIEVQYDKTAKQVDVHVLKGTLWDHMQESVKVTEMESAAAVSFKLLLSSFPDDCRAAAREDISPHLCFICLLHLANEHGLRILDNPNLDDLQIQFPTS